MTKAAKVTIPRSAGPSPAGSAMPISYCIMKSAMKAGLRRMISATARASSAVSPRSARSSAASAVS